jgi:hypothetical protein
MHVVAIHSLKEDKETLADALAGALGVTRHEALMRLRAPGAGPLVVAVFGELDPAVQRAKGLQSAGFGIAVLTAEEIEIETRAVMVKRFIFGADELHAETEGKESLSLSFPDVELILRGIGIVRSTATETEKTRSVSLRRAVLSGGMAISRTDQTEREVTTEERQGFVNLYAANGSVLVFRENALAYDSLAHAPKPTRAENFADFIARLRQRCPGARYDERLLTRAGQAALLGPTLNPEEHLSVASALLAKTLLGRT